MPLTPEQIHADHLRKKAADPTPTPEQPTAPRCQTWGYFSGEQCSLPEGHLGKHDLPPVAELRHDDPGIQEFNADGTVTLHPTPTPEQPRINPLTPKEEAEMRADLDPFDAYQYGGWAHLVGRLFATLDMVRSLVGPSDVRHDRAKAQAPPEQDEAVRLREALELTRDAIESEWRAGDYRGIGTATVRRIHEAVCVALATPPPVPRRDVLRELSRDADNLGIYTDSADGDASQ